jgi:hypothetical protein
MGTAQAKEASDNHKKYCSSQKTVKILVKQVFNTGME